MIDFEDYTDRPYMGIAYFAQAYAQFLIDGAGWSTTILGLYALDGERSSDAGAN